MVHITQKKIDELQNEIDKLQRELNGKISEFESAGHIDTRSTFQKIKDNVSMFTNSDLGKVALGGAVSGISFFGISELIKWGKGDK